MESVYQSRLGKLATGIAIGSFGLGTLLLVVGIFLPHSGDIIDVALMYIGIAFPCNMLLVFILAIACVLSKQHTYYAGKILFVAANIPVAVSYIYIFFVCHRFIHQP